MTTECSICYDTINSEDAQLIECGHVFHYDCIYRTFCNQIGKLKYKRKKRICPFCRFECQLLPSKPGFIPKKNVTEDANYFIEQMRQENYDSIKAFFKPHLCHKILKSGANKGMQCSRKKKDGSLFCGNHS